ncbi:MAG: hypothetical protein P1U47_05765 [Zhongshania sp.]|uniref:hypothetical protein n=1 Tax=Zhongshania sp. TaxID=1971902 RepID=UPI002634CBC1|nr:hypothetical protein [Zhongshania sp.]MDF1691856.1 hypothetical protein [Zhongshania sp.]
MKAANNINISIPLIGNIALLVVTASAAQLSLGALPMIAMGVALVLCITALSN